jgi:serine/threonine-protein kinase
LAYSVFDRGATFIAGNPKDAGAGGERPFGADFDADDSDTGQWEPSRLGNPMIGEKYDVLDLLGEGGMGRVFLAEHRALGRKVAIKVLREAFASRRDYVERFRREARAVAAIGHPNIIQVYEIDESLDGCPFLVMELLEGNSLRVLLSTVRRLGVEHAVDLMGQVLFALSAAHRAGIVHRDVKPENISLVTRSVTSWSEHAATTSGRRAPEMVKVLDFGLSRFLEPEPGVSTLTETGMVMGTPCYMAPEQARDMSAADGRADLFSVGAILYECLTGAVPFEGENALMVLHSVLSDPTPDPRALRPDIPEVLAAAIVKALEKDPGQRFQDADEFIAALRPFARTSGSQADSWTGKPFAVALGASDVLPGGADEPRPADSPPAEPEARASERAGAELPSGPAREVRFVATVRAPPAGRSWRTVAVVGVAVVASAVVASSLTLALSGRRAPAETGPVVAPAVDAGAGPGPARRDAEAGAERPAIVAPDPVSAADAGPEAPPPVEAGPGPTGALARAGECLLRRDQRCCFSALDGVERTREVRATLARCRQLSRRPAVAEPDGGVPRSKAPIVRDLPD